METVLERYEKEADAHAEAESKAKLDEEHLGEPGPAVLDSPIGEKQSLWDRPHIAENELKAAP